MLELLEELIVLIVTLSFLILQIVNIILGCVVKLLKKLIDFLVIGTVNLIKSVDLKFLDLIKNIKDV